MTKSVTHVQANDSSQLGYFLLLIVCAGLIAIGFSITVFGLSSSFLPELTARVGIIGTGVVTIIIGSAGGYQLLR